MHQTDALWNELRAFSTGTFARQPRFVYNFELVKVEERHILSTLSHNPLKNSIMTSITTMPSDIGVSIQTEGTVCGVFASVNYNILCTSMGNMCRSCVTSAMAPLLDRECPH